MKSPDFESAPQPGGSAENTWESAKESAAEAEQRGEECVRENPVPAIVAAFGGGLLLGVLVGWSIAESRHETYRDACRRLTREWQHRLHLD
jgi:hypothetical protein